MSEPRVSEPTVERPRRLSVSAVWIVPILAAVIGGFVAWRSLAERGPLVEIHFAKGHGITAEKTEVKHNDMVVGLVEEIHLSDDFDGVVVSARLEKDIAPYLGDTTDFWVVSAQVTSSGLSGLGTLLSGVYIEVDWAQPPTTKQRTFDGLDAPPLTPPGAPGQHVTLRAETAGSVDVGSPVLYRGLRVGQVESRMLADDFSHVTYRAFIAAPHDALLSPSTLFWNVSGVTAAAGSEGLTINVESLEALLSGGVTFGDVGVNLSQAALTDETVFRLYANRDAAEESRYDSGAEQSFFLMAQFEDSIRGLEPGAPIEWQGIRIGTVHDIVLDLSQRREGRGDINVILALQPSRIGLEDMTPDDAEESLTAWVRSGMRPQLATGNILAGRKLVRFVDDVADVGGTIDFATMPYPTIPTASSGLEAVTQNVEQIVANIAALPLDQLVGAAAELLANPDTQRLPGELNEALSAIGGAAGNIDEATRNLPDLVASLDQIADAGEAALVGVSPGSELYVDLSGAVRDLRDASRSLAALAARLEEQPNAIITGR